VQNCAQVKLNQTKLNVTVLSKIEKLHSDGRRAISVGVLSPEIRSLAAPARKTGISTYFMLT